MSRNAWVTLATNDSYSLGALVLAHSLRKTGTRHLIAVLVTPGVTEPMRETLKSTFDVVQEVNILDSKDEANLKLLKRPELGVTFTKLHCWRLTQFEKCVFLDADTMVLENADELFEREELSAAPDVGWPDCFNSGVFVYRPSNATYKSLVNFALEKGSFDGGDQGLLNMYFSDWAYKDISKHLPFIYNMCSTACYSYLPAFKQFGTNVKIVHFITNTKPWLQVFDPETRQVRPSYELQHLVGLLQHWWDIFCSIIHPALSPEMARSRQPTAHYSPVGIPNPSIHFHKANITTTDYSNYQNVWDPWEELDEKEKEDNKSSDDKFPQTFPVINREYNLAFNEQHNLKDNFATNQSESVEHGYNRETVVQARKENNSDCREFTHENKQPPLAQMTAPYFNGNKPLSFQDKISQNSNTQTSQLHLIPSSPPQPATPFFTSETEFHKESSHNYCENENLDYIQNHSSRLVNEHNTLKTFGATDKDCHIDNSKDIQSYDSIKEKYPMSYETNTIQSLPFDSFLPNELSEQVSELASSVTKGSAFQPCGTASTDESSAGFAGAFARLTLGEPRSAEQSALEDQLRRQGWEVGNIDYMGRDSFDNIWNKICETLASDTADIEKESTVSPGARIVASEEKAKTEQILSPEVQKALLEKSEIQDEIARELTKTIPASLLDKSKTDEPEIEKTDEQSAILKQSDSSLISINKIVETTTATAKIGTEAQEPISPVVEEHIQSSQNVPIDIAEPLVATKQSQETATMCTAKVETKAQELITPAAEEQIQTSQNTPVDTVELSVAAEQFKKTAIRPSPKIGNEAQESILLAAEEQIQSSQSILLDIVEPSVAAERSEELSVPLTKETVEKVIPVDKNAPPYSENEKQSQFSATLEEKENVIPVAEETTAESIINEAPTKKSHEFFISEKPVKIAEKQFTESSLCPEKESSESLSQIQVMSEEKTDKHLFPPTAETEKSELTEVSSSSLESPEEHKVVQPASNESSPKQNPTPPPRKEKSGAKKVSKSKK